MRHFIKTERTKNCLDKIFLLRYQKEKTVSNYIDNFLKLTVDDALIMMMQVYYRTPYEEWVRNYFNYLKEMGYEYRVFSLEKSVFCFSQENGCQPDRLLSSPSLSNYQKKNRMYALIFFSKFLCRETNGLIKKIKMPAHLAKIKPKPKSKSIPAKVSHGDISKVLSAAFDINTRDGLILYLVYFLERSVSKVISMKLEDIHLDEQIFYGQATSPPTFIVDNLKNYIDSSKEIRKDSPYIFVSNRGNKLARTQVQKTLEKTLEKVDLPYRITTKMIMDANRSTMIVSSS